MSGVYNSLANAHSSRSYELTYTETTDRLCFDEPVEYQFRCFVELTLGMNRHFAKSYDETLRHMRTLPRSVREPVLQALFDDEVRHELATPTPERAFALCRPLTDMLELRACVSGIALAMKYQSSGSADTLAGNLFQLCLLTDGELQTYCVGQAFSNLSSFFEHDAIRAYCERTLPANRCTLAG